LLFLEVTNKKFSMPSISPRPGQVWKVDLGFEGKVRWFIIVSRFDNDAPRALALGVPITTKYRGSSYEVALGKLPALREESYANVQGLAALRWNDLMTQGGQVPATILDEIKKTLRFTLEL
jgi:mRNA-degrading endonuclease toxin of MazEF toxin-antitoxin module